MFDKKLGQYNSNKCDHSWCCCPPADESANWLIANWSDAENSPVICADCALVS